MSNSITQQLSIWNHERRRCRIHKFTNRPVVFGPGEHNKNNREPDSHYSLTHPTTTQRTHGRLSKDQCAIRKVDKLWGSLKRLSKETAMVIFDGELMRFAHCVEQKIERYMAVCGKYIKIISAA